MHHVVDVGRWREDGAILIEGRVSGDTRIKLGGIQINVKEIEAVLLEAASGLLSEAVVTVLRSSPSSPEFLVAHVVFDPASPEERREELLQSLLPSLPFLRYMCPAVTIPLQQIPRTSSAKLDRRAVSSLSIPNLASNSQQQQQQEADADLSRVQKELRDLWIQAIH
ncbi:hypothetical protein F4779DRAFT_614737 [Xylariaceae sp. FL0662B]|nr:hypothetical protein F4779DRAFT_614737 [Xylariaceae sp. FL0662B]